MNNKHNMKQQQQQQQQEQETGVTMSDSETTTTTTTTTTTVDTVLNTPSPSSQPTSLESYCESTPGWKSTNFFGFDVDCEYYSSSGGTKVWLDCDSSDPVLGPAKDHCCQCRQECCPVRCGAPNQLSVCRPGTSRVITRIGYVGLGVAAVYLAAYYYMINYWKPSSSNTVDNEVETNDDDDKNAAREDGGGSDDGLEEEFQSSRPNKDEERGKESKNQ